MLCEYLLPHHWLSRWIGKLARCRVAWLKNMFITWFVKRYQVDMQLAVEADPLRYQDFNAFFTRALKKDARPIAAGEHCIISPADGCISQLGAIEQGRIFQAKGFDFNAVELLGGDNVRAAPYQQGKFATIYLAPKDYHRVHMPLTGTLTEMVYIPGRLFSVNNASAAAIPRLFARNERIVAIFDTALGKMAVVMVGAMIVASIETVWSGLVAPSRARDIQVMHYREGEITLQKADELGRFQLGSTVILLFAADIQWNKQLQPGSVLHMGQNVGGVS